MKRNATVKDSFALPSLPSTKRQSDPITLRYVSPDRSEPHRKRKAALPTQYSPGPRDGKIPVSHNVVPRYRPSQSFGYLNVASAERPCVRTLCMGGRSKRRMRL